MSETSIFITNDPGNTLKDKFRKYLNESKQFDVLVGYFYLTGFHELYDRLDKTEKIRILIGISTDKETLSVLGQREINYSKSKSEEEIRNQVSDEFEQSDDNSKIEKGVEVFREWLKSGKLEIRAYVKARIHSKVYILHKINPDHDDRGTVITGSSNLTKAGLSENLEFNAKIKDDRDFEYALKKFEELWKDSIDAREILDESIENSWINKEIKPYELYLKMLYEYFKNRINADKEIVKDERVPEYFKKYRYQYDAVKDAKQKLDEYGGVFLADVVGLGKTYMASLLATQYKGRWLVIAPPTLVDENNPGSWPNVFREFNVNGDPLSIGKIDSYLDKAEFYDNIIIDEAHRFRNESIQAFENISRICRGKRVVLVSATPMNNKPEDILTQIKLFQNSKKSTFPGLPDLEKFFRDLSKKLNNLDRRKDYDEYMKITRKNANEIREKVLKYVLVRRTRKDIEKYYEDDLINQGLKFPEVKDPRPIYYEFNDQEDYVFQQSIEIITKKFKYSRYTPFLYFTGDISQLEEASQRNMSRFMKILLVKRLESSSFAFKKSLARFIKSYERFIEEFENGSVWVSKKYSKKVFDLLENDDDEALRDLIEKGKVQKFDASEFKPELLEDLKSDLEYLKMIKGLWDSVDGDPKLLKFIDILKKDKVLKKNKMIIFSESMETVDYLKYELENNGFDKIAVYHGQTGESFRKTIIDNFDANVKHPKNDYRILIATEVLSEGISLHRSNCVINYDIPWNPTRMMQRVGRVNRVNTKFDVIHTYNFFPTAQSNDEIKLKEAAEAKIESFIEMLGSDAKLLTETEDIKSFDLFKILNSKETIAGENEEESDLKYLKVIRSIRDNDENLFSKIKKLPKKSRSVKTFEVDKNSLITFFRKGKLLKFLLSDGASIEELDFMTAAKTFECDPDTKREAERRDYFELLNKNKDQFAVLTAKETKTMKSSGGQDHGKKILGFLKLREIKNCQKFTENDELFLKQVENAIKEGAVPKKTLNSVAKEIKSKFQTRVDPLVLLSILRERIPKEFLTEFNKSNENDNQTDIEVILSEYLVAEDKL